MSHRLEKPANSSPNGTPTTVLADYEAFVGVLADAAKRAPTTLTLARLEQLRDHFVSLGAVVDSVGRSA